MQMANGKRQLWFRSFDVVPTLHNECTLMAKDLLERGNSPGGKKRRAIHAMQMHQGIGMLQSR